MDELDELPVLAYKDEILKTMHCASVFICLGETGSGLQSLIVYRKICIPIYLGKTTQIPQICIFDKISPYKRMAVTQPRRVAAIVWLYVLGLI